MLRCFFSLLLSGTILSVASVALAEAPQVSGKLNGNYTYNNGQLTVPYGATATETGANNMVQASEKMTFTNNGDLTTEDGHGYYMYATDKTSLSGTKIINKGQIKTTGNGYGIYAHPMPNQKMTTGVYNYGTLERIHLYQSADADIFNGEDYGDDHAALNGSVLLGTQARVYNRGQMASKAGENNTEFPGWSGSLLWMDRDSELVNGAYEVMEDNPKRSDGSKRLNVYLNPNATITTDNIYFSQSGRMYHSGTIENQVIKAGDTLGNAKANGFQLYLMNNPYHETARRTDNRNSSHLLAYTADNALNKVDSTMTDQDELAVLKTGLMDLGDMAMVRADQGSTVVADTLRVGQQANVQFGADYYWTSGEYYQERDQRGTPNKKTAETWEREIIINKEVADQDGKITTTDEERTLNTIPLASKVSIAQTLVGADSVFSAKNTTYTGENFTLGKTGALTFEGSRVFLNKSDGTGGLTADADGTLELKSYWQDEVSLSDDRTRLNTEALEKAGEEQYIRSKIDAGVVSNYVRADSITMQDGGTLSLIGTPHKEENIDKNLKDLAWWTDSVVFTSKLDLGNNSTLSMAGGTLTGNALAAFNITQDATGYHAELARRKDEPALLDITLGDNSSLTTATDAQNVIYAGSLTFGKEGTLQLKSGGGFGLSWVEIEKAITMGDDGKVLNNALIKAGKLDMGDRAEIRLTANGTRAVVEAPIYVGNDSNIYLTGADIDGGLFKKENKKNVNVYSVANAAEGAEFQPPTVSEENSLLGSVNVDDIYVQTGGLQMGKTNEDHGDIYGNIHLASDTWLRLRGKDVRVYDPVKKDDGTTNTTVWLDLLDNGVFNMDNIFDTDLVLIGGGTLNVLDTVTADNVLLDTAGSVRVYDNDLIRANIGEWQNSSVNTTVFVAPKYESLDSFGTIQVDRVVVENGAFNTRHAIWARGSDDGKPEGFWLGSRTALNILSDVETSQIIRREDVAGAVENTTVNVNGGRLTVDWAGDMDNLILNQGSFVFKNLGKPVAEDKRKNLKITNDVVVNGGTFLVNGTTDAGSGRLIIGGGTGNLNMNGGTLGVSTDALAKTDTAGQMNLSANLKLGTGSTLDLRTTDVSNDKIKITGNAVLQDKIRVILRGLKANTDYELLSATGTLDVSPDALETSFLWHNVRFENRGGNSLWLNTGYMTTLPEEFATAGVSDNIQAMGGALSELWDGNHGPFDGIFYATNVNDAARAVAEYVPEGIVNAPQATLRTSATFQNVAWGVMDDTRRLSLPGRNGRVRSSYRRSAYYGRSGGDTLYRSYVGDRTRGSYIQRENRTSIGSDRLTSNRFRTDKGGLWAKPFYVSMTQDDDKGISGYDYDTYGLAVGVDRVFGRWAWGLSGVYASGDYETTNKVIKADTDSWGVGLYGRYQAPRSPVFMNVFASYVVNANKTKHKMETTGTVVKADYDTAALGAGMALGYDIAVAPWMYVTPKVGVNWTHLTTDEVKEKGTAPILMAVKNPDVDSWQIPLEVRLAFPIYARRFELLPELHVRYTHDFGDTEYKAKARIQGTDTVIRLKSIALPENIFTLGGSLGFTAGAHEFSGRYDFETGDGLTSHLFNLGYKYLF